MPKDENKQDKDNKKIDNVGQAASFRDSSPSDNKEKTSSGKGLPDDSLLRKSKSDGNGFKEGFKNALNPNNKYNSNRGLNNGSNNNVSNNGNNNRNTAKNILDKSQNIKKKIASAVPGVGQVIKGAEIAKNTIDKIKQRRNNPNSDGSKVGTGSDNNKENKEDKNKIEDNTEKKNDKNNESRENDDSILSSGLNSITGKARIQKQIMYIGIPIVVGIVAISYLFLSGNEISSNRLNFYASTIRDEELVKNLNLTCEGIADSKEKSFCMDLREYYKTNKQFSPELLTSVLQVMMERGQYSNDGNFDYSDINSGMMRELAEKIKGSQVECTASSNKKTSSAGSTEVAGDAGVMVGSGNGLGPDYVPNVVDTRVGLDNEMCRVTQETWDAFQKMEQGAAAQGVTIGVNSCYRSYAEQATTTGNSPAAAGYSEHQLGSTIDIADRDAGYITNETVLNWLNDHAFEYGFVRSLTTMGNERHHYRYVGTKVASAFMNYINNGGVNYLTFQSTDEFKSIVGDTNSSSNSSSSNSSSTSSSSSSSSASGTSQAQKMVEVALAEEGKGEGAGGVTEYGQWFGDGMDPAAEWCGIFVAWVANHAGVGEDVIPKSGLPSFYRQWFQEKGLYHSLASEPNYVPKPGDLAIYDRGHIGIVVEYNNGQIKTIDGNSGINEDRVAIKEGQVGTYPLDVSGFASPNYSGEAVSNNTSTGYVESTDEKYREPIKNFVKQYLPKLTDERADRLVDEIFEFKNDYYELIGKKCEANCSTSSGGSGNCDYNIKGFYYSGSNHDQQLSISNLKVRLMSCSANPTPLSNELIDFEKYIMGVVYAEIGSGAPVEAMKAQAIAARSYALSRPAAMNNSGGTLLAQEDGQWILQLRGCTLDQVYCDPDAGCSNEVIKGPLDQNDLLRSAVEETKGKLLVNNEGYVINTEFRSTDQNDWSDMASGENPMDYTEILIQHYNNSRPYGASKVETMSCSGGSSTDLKCNPTNDDISTGEFSKWRQCDPRWGDVPLGGDSNICEIGCTITSISMLIAKSGVSTPGISDFNPGTFAQALKAAGITDGNGNTSTYRIGELIPQFNCVGSYDFPNSTTLTPQYRTEKLMKAQELINQGYYVLVHVNSLSSSSGHWVAIDTIQGDNIIMMDPVERDSNNLLDVYSNVYSYVYYKAG